MSQQQAKVKRVLVVGGAGKNAGLVVPELKARGVEVRALVRERPGAAEEARRFGADQVVTADLREPATLRPAMDGVDGVFHINPAFAAGEAEMGVAMVRAAQAADVEKFVFSSVYHPSVSALTNHADKQPVEEALYGSGMDFTVLQPAMFMQNFAGSWELVARTGRLVMPYSIQARVCYVDYRDVAEAAALALTADELSYGTFELAAPGMVDRVEIAAMMTRALGRQVEAGEIPPQDWNPPAGLSEAMRDGLTRMNEHYDELGFPGGNALVLRSILGREPRTLVQFFDELAER